MANVVVGWYGRGNCGDDAFKYAFRELFPGQTFQFDGGSRPLELQADDQVILGGGDVINQFYLDRIPKETSFSIVGCGLGYTSEVELLKDRKIKAALFRNRSDSELASKSGIDAAYSPDICFAMPPRAARKLPPGMRTKKLGVILSGHAEPGIGQRDIKGAAYFEYMKWELAAILDDVSQYYDIHWISFSSDVDHFDETAHYSTRKKMQKRSNQFFWPYKADEPLSQIELLASMDAVVTMKFHGAIFATIHGIPFVSIGFTRKLLEFCRASNLDNLCVRPYEFTFANVVEALKDAERPDTADKLLSVASQNRKLLRETVNLHGARYMELGVPQLKAK